MADAAPEADAQAAADAIAPQLKTITDLLDKSATIAKRSILEGRFFKEDIFRTVSFILFELLFTVKFILIKIGLGKIDPTIGWLCQDSKLTRENDRPRLALLDSPGPVPRHDSEGSRQRRRWSALRCRIYRQRPPQGCRPWSSRSPPLDN